MARKQITELMLSGVPVPFDHMPRLAEVEAYDEALREGGTVQLLVRHLVPASINARARPETAWAWKPSDTFSEETILGVIEVVKAIQEALTSPKVLSRMAELTATYQNRTNPPGKASGSSSATTTARTRTK